MSRNLRFGIIYVLVDLVIRLHDCLLVRIPQVNVQFADFGVVEPQAFLDVLDEVIAPLLLDRKLHFSSELLEYPRRFNLVHLIIGLHAFLAILCAQVSEVAMQAELSHPPGKPYL